MQTHSQRKLTRNANPLASIETCDTFPEYLLVRQYDHPASLHLNSSSRNTNPLAMQTQVLVRNANSLAHNANSLTTSLLQLRFLLHHPLYVIRVHVITHQHF